MKSVMQEASSIAKAFEQAWEKAGKPQQCSIKILEEPRHNFIGMTLQSAKIVLFFDETGEISQQIIQQPILRQAPERKQPQPGISSRNDGQAPKVQQQQPQPQREPQKPQEPKQPTAPRPDYWSEEMISFARNWLKDLLVTMDRSDLVFNVKANKFYLRFSFEKPVYADEQRERDLFRHTSYLLLQTLRNKFSRPLKGYKVVLARA